MITGLTVFILKSFFCIKANTSLSRPIDIPLADWDAVGACLPDIKWPADDWSSRSGLVCIGKQAAAQYKRSALKTHVGTGATLH